MDRKLHHNSRSLTGQRFGYLVALVPGRTSEEGLYWIYRCDCGSWCERLGAYVTRRVKMGRRTDCGCVTKYDTHGKRWHPLYQVWQQMVARCTRPTNKGWKNYGGRGIKVCKRWQELFANFWDDMEPTYSPDLQLDRIDNDQGYYPENCRWTDSYTNQNNTRKNVMVDTPKGRMTIAQASRAFEIDVTTLHSRVDSMWPDDKLFIKPKFGNRIY